MKPFIADKFVLTKMISVICMKRWFSENEPINPISAPDRKHAPLDFGKLNDQRGLTGGGQCHL